MSLTTARVRATVEYFRSLVEYRTNDVAKSQRILAEAEEAYEMWKATLEKMETSEN